MVSSPSQPKNALVQEGHSHMKKNYTLLAIETSCDEVAAAVYNTERKLLAHRLYSQTEQHKQFGGVVPEIASRSHMVKINSIVEEAMAASGCTLDDINVVAVTSKPGLLGSLLIGISFAKAIAGSYDKKLVAVDHLEGHAFSACIENDIPFPFLCMTASGGHTSLYRITDYGKFETLGTTMDDAAGEAFDKVAKMLKLGYPGGPIIEKLAGEVNFEDFFDYPRNKMNNLMFSFSGLKTAVLYDLVKKRAYSMEEKTLLTEDMTLKKQVASSFLNCVADIFVGKITKALQESYSAEATKDCGPTALSDYKAIAFVGGVACNKFIRNQIQQRVANKYNIPLYFPSPEFCTDNAAMIAFVGHYKAQRDEFSPLDFEVY